MIIKKLPPPSHHGRGSFQNSIRYALAGHHKILSQGLIVVPDGVELRGEVLSHGGIIGMPTAAIEMDARAALSTRCQDPVFHAVISYHPDENPSDAEQCSDVTEMLANLNMGDCQHIAIRHRDTRHQHIHVIVNRVRADGRAVPLSHDWTALEQTHARIAARRGWSLVEGPRNRQVVAELIEQNPSLQRHPRDAVAKQFTPEGEVKLEALIEDLVKHALTRARTWQQFQLDLARQGIAVERTEKVGRGRQEGNVFYGIRFRDQHGRMCKGSDVGARYATLTDRFGPWVAMTPEIEDHNPGRHHANDTRPCCQAIDQAVAYRAYCKTIKTKNDKIRSETSEAYAEIRKLRYELNKHRAQQRRVKSQRRWRNRNTLRYHSTPILAIVVDWLIDLVVDSLNKKERRLEAAIGTKLAGIRRSEPPLSFHAWLRDQNGLGGPWRPPAPKQQPAPPDRPRSKPRHRSRSAGYERN